MEITKRSMMSGVIRTRDIPVTQEQLNNWMSGELIQNAMPNLTPAEREFIKSGITEDEWETLNEIN
jgi:hypothetical protein